MLLAIISTTKTTIQQSMLNYTELCVLRMHCVKWVLHLRSVDAGAARQKKHKKDTNLSEIPRGHLAHQKHGAS